MIHNSLSNILRLETIQYFFFDHETTFVYVGKNQILNKSWTDPNCDVPVLWTHQISPSSEKFSRFFSWTCRYLAQKKAQIS